MQSTGSGLTFTDQDVRMMRVILGLLSRSSFKALDAAAIREAAAAFQWAEEMVQKIKDNVLDYSQAKILEPVVPSPPEPVPGKRGKK